MSMVSPRPQLSREDLARLQWLLGSLLALLSATTVFFLEIEAWLLVVGITVAAVAALVRPAWPVHVPRWVHRLAFPFMLGAFALDLYLSREPLAALIRLDLLLILYRLISHRTRREDLQLIVLGLFLIVVAGVLSVSIAFAAQILAFAACSLLFLFVITLAENQPNAPATEQAPSWTRGRWRDLFGRVRAATEWRLVVLCSVLFGAMVVVSGLLFLAIPRFEVTSGLFLDRLINRKTLSGFSDSIRFGEVTEIMQDNALALMVDVEGGDPSLLPPVPYWRMVVLDDYTGSGFDMAPGLRSYLARSVQTRNHDVGTLPPRPGAIRLYLEAGVSRYLPLLGSYHRLQFSEPQTFAVHDGRRLVALQRDPPKMLAYQVSGMESGGVLADPTFQTLVHAGDSQIRGLLAVPVPESDRARLERIVTQLRGGEAELGVADFASRTTDWLERTHAYSLQSTLPPGAGDPLVRWLDSTTPGHCEFFAGAMVLLARTAGYPARVVTGFKGGTWNSYSNSLTVRNANAHAWCELFDEAAGAWLRVDPTPGAEAAARLAEEGIDAGRSGRAWDTGWLARMESLRVFWYRRIVNFDQESQLELTTAAKHALRRSAERLRTWVDARAKELQDWLARPWGLERFVNWAAGLATVVVLFWTWRLAGRGWWLRWRSQHTRKGRDPIRREAGRWLKRLDRRSPTARPPPPDIRDALIRLRYGAPHSWPDPAATFRAARRIAKR